MLTDKIVVITGAAGALGQVVTAVAAAQGAKPVLLDLAFPAGFAVSHPHYAVDLGDRQATAQVFHKIGASIGAIDAVVNLAGGFDMGPTADQISDESWDAMFDLNVKTLRHVIAAAVPGMRERRRGAMVNVGAMGAVKGLPNMAAYSASKSVVMRLTESLAEELRGEGVNVNAVLPSVIDTPRNRADMPEADPSLWVAPGDLAQVICFLISDAARAVHGALLPVRGLS